MSPIRTSVRLAIPLGLTVLLLAARLAAIPAISDPVHGAAPPSLHLTTPWLYLVLAPFFTLWDGVSMLSMSRLKGFLLGLLVLYLVWRASHTLRSRARWLRELAVLAISLGLLLAFLIIGALWHRPMLALDGN